MSKYMWSETHVCVNHEHLIIIVLNLSFSCGNVGKLTRIADAIAAPSFTSLYPRKNPNAPFLVLGGYIDFLVPSTYANGHGAITGLANLFPVTRTLYLAYEILSLLFHRTL